MPSFSEALGIHADAVRLRSHRATLLATNVANAETPGYRARDIDFRSILGSERSADSVMRTRSGHIDQASPVAGLPLEVSYREPLQPSVDQNTVDVQEERAAFFDNAMRYQASLRFLNGRFSGLVSAIRGE